MDLSLIIDNWFIIAVALVWIFVAVVMDFKSREVPNWWNFSLIVIAIAYRVFLSISLANYGYILWGATGLLMGFVVANLFYYMGLFAGGDAKLMIGLLVILPLSLSWKINLSLLISFLFLFLLIGGIYGLGYSIVLTLIKRKRFSKEFIKQFKKYKKMMASVGVLALVLFIFSMLLGFAIGSWLSLLIFITPLLLVYAKSVEESCLIKYVSTDKITIGDWLVNSIKVKGKTIKSNWQGISEEELAIIQRGYNKKILIKYGIPFTPTFFFAFIAMLVLYTFDYLFILI